MNPQKTLVNFNMPTEILSTFDRLCRANGKSRSMVLNDLAYMYILEMASANPSRLDAVRRIEENLKSARQNGAGDDLADPSIDRQNGVQSRANRKLFSDFGKVSSRSEDR